MKEQEKGEGWGLLEVEATDGAGKKEAFREGKPRGPSQIVIGSRRRGEVEAVHSVNRGARKKS